MFGLVGSEGDEESLRREEANGGIYLFCMLKSA